MTDGSSMPLTAVMVLAYGGPDCLDAVGPFVCELTGREPAGEMLAGIQARYAAIGGKSPLPEVAAGFAASLSARLAEDHPDILVEVGFRYAPPKISDVLRDLYSDGVRRVIGVSLSPFESRSTNTAYAGAVDEALRDLPGMQVDYTPAFGLMPEFSALHRDELAQALARLECGENEVLTLFTAHSLPVADLETPELYASGLRTVSDAIAADLGFDSGAEFSETDRLPGITSFGAPDGDKPWILAYQSKGRRPGEWLGPDISEVMEVAAAKGFQAVAVSPIGFATEHMETRYDLDIVELQRAQGFGIGFERGSAPNDSPQLIAATSVAVHELLEHGV